MPFVLLSLLDTCAFYTRWSIRWCISQVCVGKLQNRIVWCVFVMSNCVFFVLLYLVCVGQGCTSVECVGQPKWIGAPPSHRLPSYFVQLKLFICRKSSNFVQQGRASPELTIFCSTLPWNANISIPLHISQNKNDRLYEVFGAVSMLTFNNTLTLRESSSHFRPLKKLAALKESLRSH